MDMILDKLDNGETTFSIRELLQSIVAAFGESILKKDGA